MSTLGEVKTAIARRLIDEDNTAVSEVEIREAINEAIKKWKVKRFWFNSTDFDLSILEGDEQLTLPDDFLVEVPRNAVTINFSNQVYKVDKYSPTRFDSSFISNSPGRPRIFTNRDGMLEISPIADQAYAGKLYYLKDYTPFLTDGTQDNLTNKFLDEGEMLIRSEALSQIHGELRQDEKMEERYTKRVMTEYNELKTRTNKLLKTGTLTIEQ